MTRVIEIDLFEHERHSGQEAGQIFKREGWWARLDAFLQEVWDGRPQTEADSDHELDSEERGTQGTQRYLGFDHGNLMARSHVGTICFEGQTINIWPKVFQRDFQGGSVVSDQSRATLRGTMTRNMMWWLSRTNYLKLSQDQADGSTPNDIGSYFESYVWMFACFTRDLLGRQPYFQYQEEIEESGVMRGRLMLNRHVNDCLARGRWHMMVIEHEPYNFDNLFNRIIKRVCRLARSHCTSRQVRDKLDEILFELDEVEDKPCTARDCDRVHLNRMQGEYLIVLDHCRMLLQNFQVDRSGQEMQRFCFLFPMHRLFEEYLRVLAINAIPQQANRWALRPRQGESMCLAQMENGQGCFTISNDLLFSRMGNELDGLVDRFGANIVIADAKWKVRYKQAERNLGVTQADMYQMVAYAHARGATEVHLFYPAMDKSSKSCTVGKITTVPGAEGIPAVNVWVHEFTIHTEDPELNIHQELENCIVRIICDILT